MRISPGAGRRKERRRSSKASDKRWRALAGASLPTVVVDLFSDFLSLGLGERRPGKRSLEDIQDEDFHLRLRRLFLSPIRHWLRSFMRSLIVLTMLLFPSAAIAQNAQSPAACERLASVALPNTTMTLAQVVNAGAFAAPRIRRHEAAAGLQPS